MRPGRLTRGCSLRCYRSTPRLASVRSFSLIEVVISLGIFSFALVAILGMFTTGLKTTKESEEELKAANFASLLVTTLRAAPTSSVHTNWAVPLASLSKDYSATVQTNLAKLDGTTTSSSADAAYLVSYRAGTNALTGSKMAQVYLMLSWPVASSPTNANVGRYELMTQIPLP